MSFNVVNWVLENSEATKGKRLVLLVLAEVAGIDGGDAFVSVGTMAERARLSERAVQYALRDLEAEGAIASEGAHPRHGTTIYRVVGPFNEDTNAGSQGGATSAPRGVQTPTGGGASSDTGSPGPRTGGVQPTAPEPSLTNEPSKEPPDARAHDIAEAHKLLGEIAELRGLAFPDRARIERAIADYPDVDPVAAAREQRDWLCEGGGVRRRVDDIVGSFRFKLQRDAERAKRSGGRGDRAGATERRIAELRARGERRRGARA